MKKITFIMMGLLLLLGGAKVCAQTLLVLKGGENCGVPDGDNPTSGVIQFKNNVAKFSYMTNNDWVVGTEGTHTFVVTLGSSNNEECTLHIAALSEEVSFDNENNIKPGIIIKEESISVANNATLTLSVSSGYAAIILWQTSGNQWRKVNIASFTREIGGGGGGSASEGKTAVSYDIPHEVAMYTYTFEDDNNISTTGFSGGTSVTSEDHYTGSKSFKATHDGSGELWGSQFYIDLNPNDWPDGTKAILHFAIKGSGSKGVGKKMEVALQQNSGQYPMCGLFKEDLTPTDTWEPYDLPTTVDFSLDKDKEPATACNKLYFNCGAWNGDLFIDDVILYKITEETSGGSNVFTSDDQVANISSSAFSSLAEGDYICADVTGTPETIKLVCNGNNYPLTRFNGGTLWGIKATDEMVSALQANDSQFKGHDLTLNGIDIYKTVALGEEGNSTALASKINNVFVELTRSFVANTWNTVCLPFVPSAEQAIELFGSGYKLAKFTASGTEKMTFTTIDLNNEEFVAGKPYLVYPTATVSHSNKVLANVSITKTEGLEDKDNSGYKFKGSFEPTSFSGNLSLYRFIASGNELKIPTSGTLKSLRCYFEYPSPSVGGARSFTIDEEGGTTSINTVQGSGVMVNGYYNLAGQRVAKPTKGLYIVNGKKVVIK